MVCRELLLGLQRAGQIELPPVHHVHRNPPARRGSESGSGVPPYLDTTPLDAPLSTLRPLEFHDVRRTPEEPLIHSLRERYHLPGLHPTRRGAPKTSGLGPRATPGLSGLEFRAAAPGEPRPLYRLVGRSPATQYPIPRLQHPLSDSALDSGRTLGLPHSGPHGEAAIGGLGEGLQGCKGRKRFGSAGWTTTAARFWQPGGPWVLPTFPPAMSGTSCSLPENLRPPRPGTWLSPTPRKSS